MNTVECHYVGGKWVSPQGGDAIPVENPYTGATIATVPAGVPADVESAVAAAREAFEPWSSTSPAERADHLHRLEEALTRRADAIATTISAEVGTPIRVSRALQTQMAIAAVGSYVDLLRTYRFEERIGNSLVIREPVGVVGAITPWNYPLTQILLKLAPALASGCTVVLKPSELAPGAAVLLMEAINEIGLPPGVVNLVNGTGAVAGEALVTSAGVDKVSFTGSVPVGARVAAVAGSAIKRVTLELGGKSANIILDDADLPRAVKTGVGNAFLNSGQTCAAWTRMLVPAGLEDQAVELATGAAARYLPGDPLDAGTRLGPVVSPAQRAKVVGYIEAGIEQGARLVHGGPDRPAGGETGSFVAPTIFAGVDPGSVIAQEEIFGPVLCVIPYRDEDHALEIANDSQYGLHGAVWSADAERAVAFARRIKTGSVDVNGGAFNPLAPFGGFKKSGVGREQGRFGLEAFQEIKAIQL